MSEPWFLTGFSGAGKTTVGRLLADRSGRRFLDLDALVEEAAGLSVERLIGEQGLARFRALEEQVLRAALEDHRDTLLVLSLGGGTLELPGSRQLVLSSGGCLAWLQVPLPECLRRIRAEDRPGRPLLEQARAAGGEAALADLHARRLPLHALAEVSVDGTGAPDDVARALHDLLAGTRR